jgi:hypothetical protein
MVRLKELGKLENGMTLSEFEPAAFQLVAQRHNKLRYPFQAQIK